MKRTVFLTLAFMKRSLLVLLPLLGAFSLLTSCSDDDEPQPEWSFLYGEWMPAGKMYYERMIDGSREFYNSSAYFPNDIRLIFSPLGSVSVSGIDERADLPWEDGNYSYEVRKDREGKYILQFGGFEGEFWYNVGEDALYYYLYDSRYIWDIHYVFKRPVEKGSLPIQKRDKNVELMPVGGMPEWMQKRVSGESAAHKDGANYTGRPRIHQFTYKGETYYHFYSQLSSSIEWGYFYTDTGEDFFLDAYNLIWRTTDWKLIYIFPRN